MNSRAERIRAIKARKPFKAWDIVLIAALVLASALLWALSIGGQGAVAHVYRDGKLLREISLQTDGEYTVYSADGSGSNVISVKDGRLSVSEANCDDQICVHYGAIGLKNQTIICLPHGITIVIVDGDPWDIDIET